MIPFSVLDLAPVVKGSTPAQAFQNTLDLARHVEQLGFRRYWLAEHHNMPGIASSATAVVIAHVAAGTTHIRVGAGGIMLPNHPPLVIAEQLGRSNLSTPAASISASAERLAPTRSRRERSVAIRLPVPNTFRTMCGN